MPTTSKEELEDFLKKADKAHELITLLGSKDDNVIKSTQDKIDNILKSDWEEEEEGCVTKVSKSQINKIGNNPGAAAAAVPGPSPDYGDGSQEGFMRAMEEDANKRAEERGRREVKSKVRREKGNASFKAGEYAKAIEEYEVAIRLTGWEVSLYTNKAQCYIRLNQLNEAIAACDRALYIEDDFVKGYVQKSIALIAKGELSDSVTCLEEAMEKCKSTVIIEKYLEKAKHLLDIKNRNGAVLKGASEDKIKEFKHFVSKLGSEKTFESLISAEFLLKSVEHTPEGCQLIRALGGIQILMKQINSTHTEAALYTSLFTLLKHILITDKMSFLSWMYSEPAFIPRDDSFACQVILLLHKIIFAEDEYFPTTFLEHWTCKTLMKLYLSGFEDPVSKPMCMLILGRLVQSTKFLTRFKVELVAQIKKIGDEISGKHDDLKTLISSLSALSMTETSRKILDQKFWSNFLAMLDKAPDGSIDDLLSAGMNLAIGSESLKTIGVDITPRLIELCGERKRAAPLLNRVLEKCPNSQLAEDKGQFAALLKVIKQRSSVEDENLSTAIKLLARTTAESVQARKWVVKYKILEALLQILDENTVVKETPKSATAVISNSALVCGHCFLDEALCKKQEPDVVDLFLKHAKAEKGLVIQQNAAIALARLAKSSPILLERLRQTRGLEILHSRY